VLSLCGLTEDGTGSLNANVLNGAIVPLIRSSKRNARTSDHDSLEKASKLKARKNLDSYLGEGKEFSQTLFIQVEGVIFKMVCLFYSMWMKR
jgi:hypothetical protein